MLCKDVMRILIKITDFKTRVSLGTSCKWMREAFLETQRKQEKDFVTRYTKPSPIIISVRGALVLDSIGIKILREIQRDHCFIVDFELLDCILRFLSFFEFSERDNDVFIRFIVITLYQERISSVNALRGHDLDFRMEENWERQETLLKDLRLIKEHIDVSDSDVLWSYSDVVNAIMALQITSEED